MQNLWLSWLDDLVSLVPQASYCEPNGNAPRPAADETLVRYLAGLTVAERLALNDAAVRVALELRAGFAALPTTADVDANDGT